MRIFMNYYDASYLLITIMIINKYFLFKLGIVRTQKREIFTTEIALGIYCSRKSNCDLNNAKFSELN